MPLAQLAGIKSLVFGYSVLKGLARKSSVLVLHFDNCIVGLMLFPQDLRIDRSNPEEAW